MQIMLGYKTVECRSWPTKYRGYLLICASSKPWPLTIDSHAISIAKLIDVALFTEAHLEEACMEEMPPAGSYAWIFEPRHIWIEPFPVKGRQRLFDVDDSLIQVLPDDVPEATCLREYYEPLMNFGKNGEAREIWEEIIHDFS